MQLIQKLLFAFGAFLFASQSVVASARTSNHTSLLQRTVAGTLTLSIENGFGGILAIRYLAALPDKGGRVTYVLFTDPKQFEPFSDKVSAAEGSIVADIDGTGLRVRLMATTGGVRLFGHVIQTSDRVIILPTSAKGFRDFRIFR